MTVQEIADVAAPALTAIVPAWYLHAIAGRSWATQRRADWPA